MALSNEAGFDYAPNTQRTWTFPLTMTEYGRPFQVSLSSSAPAFQEKDARLREEIAVVFRVDRPATEHPISIRFRLSGTAYSKDYEVVDRPREDTLQIQPNEREAKLVLRRLPGPRGLGDRVLEVAGEPVSRDGQLSFATGRQRVDIAIPDPAPALDWSVPQPGIDASDPLRLASTTLTVTIKPPSSKRISLRYRIVSPNRSGVPAQERTIELVPPADLWSGEPTAATQILEFPPDDLMQPFDSPNAEADLAMRFRIEPAADSPYKPKPIELRLPTADKKALAGHVLVILVHTSDLGGNDDLVWSEFRQVLDQADKEGLRNRLVDRSIFVLDAHKDLYRLRLESIKHLERFPRDTALEQILDKLTKTFLQSVIGRISQEEQGNAKPKKVLVLRDLGKKPGAEVVKALNDALPGDNWWVFCIDPNADGSSLAREVAEVQKGADLVDFAIFKDKLAEKLLALLKSSG
jgi:hypothetical protein